MASYALPVSAIPHSHLGHGHVRTHSHSPRQSHAASPRKSSLSSSATKMRRQDAQRDAYRDKTEPVLEQHHGHSYGLHTAHEVGHADGIVHEYGMVYEANQALKLAGSSMGISISPAMDGFETEHHSHHATTTLLPDAKHSHLHGHHHETKSAFTRALLPWTQGYPLLYTILAEKDSRRIAYFMSLNFAFMMVQAVYGFLTDSLGLLSDSIHMFFDCLALGVGLFAAVASKWPPSERFPYGFGKIESLSGFGNGVFLIIEIMAEASERLVDGRETKRLNELLVVSTLGLLVNLVGMACFGHHHGHGHGDCAAHAHSHAAETSHMIPSEDHHHRHHHPSSCDHGHHHSPAKHHHHHPSPSNHLKDKQSPCTSPEVDKPPTPMPAHHHHSHSHDNENMRGIFLHVLADTMGSGAVIVSTLLIRYAGWSGWDPVASCIIAILIFISSIPLVTSSARKLLLTIPDDIEYSLRDTLGEVANLRGVESLCVPRFWLGDGGAGTRGGSKDARAESVMGVMHVCATRGSEYDDVRDRVQRLLTDKRLNVVVQVECHGDASCWCGGSTMQKSRRGSTSSRFG